MSIAMSELSCSRLWSGRWGTLGGGVQSVDVEFAHLQHRLHGSLRLLGARVREDLVEAGRGDLPGEAVFVLEPATHALLASVGGELLPVVVDLVLVLAVDLERDRLVERKLG